MKYRGIVLLKTEGHSVSLCCELLDVSSSGFYDWKKRLPSDRAIKNGEIKAKILNIFSGSRKTYGPPRIKAALERSGDLVGKDRVARLMKKGSKPGVKRLLDRRQLLIILVTKNLKEFLKLKKLR